MWHDLKKSIAHHLGRYIAIGIIAIALGAGGVYGTKWYWQHQKEAIAATTKAKYDAAKHAADRAVEKAKDAADVVVTKTKDAAREAADIAAEKAKRAAERTRGWRDSIFGTPDSEKEPVK